MKPAHIVISRVLVVLALILFWLSVALIFTPAQAVCWHCEAEQGPPGADGIDGIDGEAGLNGVDGKDYLHDDDAWSDDDLDQMFAASTAMAGIDFYPGTDKLQLGFAIGGYGGETQGALGIGKVLDNDSFGDILVSFKTTIDEVGRDNDRAWVASATWKVRID